jgi:murein DD-endopeptidase MepM/ murein hydrolase activator NlpD
VNDYESNTVIMGGSRIITWISGIAWLIALGCVLAAIFLGWEHWQNSGGVNKSRAEIVINSPTQILPNSPGESLKSVPAYKPVSLRPTLTLLVSLYTNIPNRPRQSSFEYEVLLGDSVFSIASENGLSPETILWSNYGSLKDNPHSLVPGMLLNIPPINGVYYQWQQDDTLSGVATEFRTDAEKIMAWSGNKIDLTNPDIKPETWVMIPDGQREFQQWIIPVMPRGAAGVSTGMYGAGTCPGGYDGLYGSGAFIWPSVNRGISGNDYWSGHLAIDIGTAPGEAIFAADSGVVVFSGWALGGYGNVVAIDHGNGYQTLYAHLNGVNVGCGRSVSQGQTIGFGGSTGNSTGPHLHFEIRYQGGFVNPWYVLPAP